MIVQRHGSVAARQGGPDAFTGEVYIDWRIEPEAPARSACALLRFSAGARTAWHSHPLGQTLVVVSGTGWTQCDGEQKVEIRTGDVIWCPPGHRHWHGATATTPMAHIAVTETLDGCSVDWFEAVSDDDYLGSTVRHD